MEESGPSQRDVMHGRKQKLDFLVIIVRSK